VHVCVSELVIYVILSFSKGKLKDLLLRFKNKGNRIKILLYWESYSLFYYHYYYYLYWKEFLSCELVFTTNYYFKTDEKFCSFFFHCNETVFHIIHLEKIHIIRQKLKCRNFYFEYSRNFSSHYSQSTEWKPGKKWI
jgi:hypothetical protein